MTVAVERNEDGSIKSASRGNKYDWSAGLKGRSTGTAPARLVRVIECGLQPQIDYKTKEEKPPQDMLDFTFEFPGHRVQYEDGTDRPAWVSKTMNIYFSEKSNLAKLVSVLDPDGKCDDIQGLLGRACLVTLGFTSGGNVKITGFLPLIEGMDVPELENEATYFDRDNPDWDLFNSFPPFIKERLTVECLNVPEDWDLEVVEESQY